MTDTLRYFNELYDPAKNHMQGMAAEWDEYEKAYLGEPERTKPSGRGAWRSFIHFKYAWQQAQTLVAEISADPDPAFVWEPRNAHQTGYAETVQGVVGEQFQRDDYAEKRFMSVLTAAVYGGCPVKVHWLFDKHGDVVCEDRPTASLLDPRSFFYDPRARHMREARYAGHVMRMEYAELKARKRADGTPLYDLSKLPEPQATPSEHALDTDTNELDNDHSGERDKARRKGLEVVELWTRDRIMVRANGVIIRNDPNPHPYGRLPFEVIRLIPSLNDVWGISLMWALRDPQSLIQSLDNAAMDQIKFVLDPPRAVDSDDPTNETREWEPGAVYPSRNPGDAVKLLNGSIIDPNSAQAAINNVRALTKQISGITDELSGQSQADTATQAAMNQRQSKGRVGVMMTSVDSGWARIAQMFLQLDQKYLDLSVPVRVMGEKAEWRHLRPSEIGGLWDVRPKNSSERIVKELHRENLMNAIAALGAFADRTTAAGKTIDVTPFAEELAESFGFAKERVVVDAALMRAQRQADVVADAQAQAEAMKFMPPAPPAPAPIQPQQAEPSLIEQAQSKLFSSINYKDLPNEAQAAMLDQIGLPNAGVESDDDNPTRPNAGKQSVSGQSEGQKARRAVEKGAPSA